MAKLCVRVNAGACSALKILVTVNVTSFLYFVDQHQAISDLLKPERTNLVIREDARRGVYVDGLSEWVVRSRGEVHSLLQQGSLLRRTSATRINELSSRSHAVFIIIVEHAIEKSSHEVG